MFKVVEAAESNSNEDNYMDMKFHFQIFNKNFCSIRAANQWVASLYRTRVFIGESNIWQICLWEAIGDLSYHVFLLKFLCLEQWIYGCVYVVINIGKFSEKSPIANINSSPINCLVW